MGSKESLFFFLKGRVFETLKGSRSIQKLVLQKLVLQKLVLQISQNESLRWCAICRMMKNYIES